MKLDYQSLSIPLLPLDTRADAQGAPSGRVTMLENGRYHKSVGEGGLSIKKRAGHAALSGLSMPSPHRIGTFGDDLIGLCKDGVYRWSRTGQSTAQILAGATWTPTVRMSGGRPAIATTTTPGLPMQQLAPSCFYVSGYYVITWTEGPLATAYYSVYDAAGAAIALRVNSGLTSSIHAVAVGTRVILFEQNAFTVKAFDLSAPTTLLTGAVAGGAFRDARVRAGGVDVLLHSAGNVLLARLDPTTLTFTATRSAAANSTNGSALLEHDHADGNIWIVNVNSTTNQFGFVSIPTSYAAGTVYAGTHAATASFHRHLSGWVVPTTLERVAVYRHPGTSVLTKIAHNGAGAVTVGTAFSTTGQTAGLYLASQAWLYNGRGYALAVYYSSTSFQPTAFVVDLLTGAVVGQALQTVAGDYESTYHTNALLSKASAVGSDAVVVGVIKQNAVITSGVTAYQNAEVVAVELSAMDARLGAPVEFAGSAFIPGGIVRQYDGATVSEAGFLLDPEQPTLVNTGGTLPTPATYEYLCVYAWTDANGRVWRSAPSVSRSITYAAGAAATQVTCRAPLQTAKTEVLVELYRKSGTIWYKVTPQSYSASGGTVVIVDNQTSVLTGEILYTNGGAKENEPPPPSTVLATFKDRLVAISAEDGGIAYSKGVKDGTGVAWGIDFTIAAQNEDGAFTAAMQHDSTLYLWKRGAVYGLSGDGPTDAGGGDFYQYPARVSVGHGCTVPTSVVSTPAGPAFFATRGVVMLLADTANLARQGAAAQALGEPLFDYAALTVRGAVLLPQRNVVAWMTSDGTALVYDYVVEAWSVDTGRAALGAVASAGELAWVKSDGTGAAEVTGSSADAGAAFITKADVVLNMGGIGGFGRCRRLMLVGERVADHTVKVSIAYDGAAAAAESHTRAVTSADAGAYRFPVGPKHGRATVLRLTIEDVFPGGASAGGRWTGLAADVGVIPRMARRANAAKMTAA